MELTAASTAASAAITLIPGDVATPIATKLADISGYFVIVICALYLEKYLLTILGAAACKVLIPLGCVMWALTPFWKKPFLKATALKLFAFAAAIMLIVPASAWVSDMIETTYGESINATLEAATETVEDLESNAESAVTEAAENASDGAESTESELSWWDKLTGTVTSAAGDIIEAAKDKVTVATSTFERVLNNMIEALAVMIVTSCVIPILVLMFFVWLIKLVFNVSVPMPPMGRPPVPGK
jgi:ABC-type multidrug transport system fused ATPase/permease subunit